MDDDAIDRLWTDLEWMFSDEDDSPLPELLLQGVPPGDAAAIWRRLLRDASILPDATVYVTAQAQDVPAAEIADLASRAERGEIDMHLVLIGVIAQGLRLPDLGVSIYPGQVALDYRVNVWDSRSAAAFISLLAELQSLAAGATLVAADEAGRPYNDARQKTVGDAVLRVLRP